MATAVSACFATSAYSLPTDPNVVSGSASIAQVGNALNVTNSNGAIINWNTFSIGASEVTRFIQPSSSSSVLNRVLADPSVILGTLTSNGRVFLINPNGILVGPGAHINVAGFVASTLNISDSNFLANKLQFDATPNAGSVVNQGSITTPSGGSVYLVAPEVTNEGIITTPQGETILAAGQSVTLLDTATPGVSVEIVGAAGNATNLGTIAAEAGQIGIAGVLVKNSGTLNASSVVKEGGKIFLRASQDAYVDGDGRIVTTGSKGGRVEVLGNRVAVMDNAEIDASGANGGGEVLIGGDFQGKNPDVQNSQMTYLGQNATIKADATDKGDGGKVIVWADDSTQAYGNISARGGSNGGDGGLVETSGHMLDIAGLRVDTRAPQGTIGEWLLDPVDVSITDYGGFPTSGGASLPFTPVSNSTIYAEDLSIALGYSDVTIQTQGGSGGQGDISVANAHIGGYYGLSLIAYGGDPSSTGDITVQDSQIGISGQLIFSAGDDGVGGSAPGKGNVTITNAELEADGVSVYGGGNLTITATTGASGLRSTGDMWVGVDGDVKISGGNVDGAYAGLDANGNQHVEAGGDIALQAGSANSSSYGGYGYGSSAGILNFGGYLVGGAQEIIAHSIELRAGATGHDNRAMIRSMGGDQSLTINGGHLLIQGGGDASASVYGGAGSFNNEAGIDNFGYGPGSQIITVYGGGLISLEAGNGTGTLGWGNASNNTAQIRTESYGGQIIDFYDGGSLTLLGGSAGTNNYANIEGGYYGFQSIGSSTGAFPSIALYGGAGGGGPGSIGPYGYDGASNDAGIHLDEENTTGTQTISASSMYISAGDAAYGGAGLGGAYQVINVTDDLTMLGGSSSGFDLDGAPGSAAYIGSMYGASINLNVGGNFTATAGSGAGGAVLIGSLQDNANVDIQVGGNVTLNGAASASGGGVRIGSDGPNPSGHVVIDAGGDVTINGNGGGVAIGAKDIDDTGWNYVDIYAGDSSYGGNFNISGTTLINSGSNGGVYLDANAGSDANTGNISQGVGGQIFGDSAKLFADRNIDISGAVDSYSRTRIEAGYGASEGYGGPGGSIRVFGSGQVSSFGYDMFGYSYGDGTQLIAHSGTDGAATGSIKLDAGSTITASGGYDTDIGTGLVADRDINANGSVTGYNGVGVYAGGNITVGDGTAGNGAIDAPHGAIALVSGTYAYLDYSGSITSILSGSYGYSGYQSAGGDITVKSGAMLHAADWIGLYGFGAASGGNVQTDAGSSLVGDGDYGVYWQAVELEASRNATVNGSVTATTYGVRVDAGIDIVAGYFDGTPTPSGLGGDVVIGGQIAAPEDVDFHAFSDSSGAGGGIIQNSGGMITGYTVNFMANRNISLDGQVTSTETSDYGYSVDVRAGYGSSYGGDLLLGTNSNISGGYLNFEARLGSAANGDITQAAGGAIAATFTGYSSSLLADGSLLLDGSLTHNGDTLWLNSGYSGASGKVLRVSSLTAPNSGSIYLDSTGDAQIGVINAPLSHVSMHADGAILDENGNTLNITANTLDLISMNGGAMSTSLAISVDTAATTSIGGYVYSGATYGGISIRNQGAQPSEFVRLNDDSTYGGGLAFTNTGDIHTGLGDGLALKSFSGGNDNIDVASLGGNLVIDGGDFYLDNPASKLSLGAASDLTVSSSLSPSTSGSYSYPDLALHAGGNLTQGDSISGNNVEVNVVGNLSQTSGNIWGYGSTIVNVGGDLTQTSSSIGSNGYGAIMVGGTLSSSNSYLFADADLVIHAGMLDQTGGGMYSYQNLTLTSGTLSTYGGGIFADNALAITASGPVTVDGDSTLSGYGSLDLTSSGAILIDGGSHVTADGQVKVEGNTVSLKNGGHIHSFGISGAGIDVFAATGVSLDSGAFIDAAANPNSDVNVTINDGNLTLNNDSHIYAARDVFVKLGGANAKVILNAAAGGIPSTIETGVPLTTTVGFETRITRDGIVIDGTPTTTTTSGGSGFYADGSPAAEGAGLTVVYTKPPSVDGTTEKQAETVTRTTDTIIEKITETAPSEVTSETEDKQDEEEKKRAEQNGDEGNGQNEEDNGNVGQCV